MFRGWCRAHRLTQPRREHFSRMVGQLWSVPPGVGTDGRRSMPLVASSWALSDEPLLDAVVVGFEMELEGEDGRTIVECLMRESWGGCQ